MSLSSQRILKASLFTILCLALAIATMFFFFDQSLERERIFKGAFAGSLLVVLLLLVVFSIIGITNFALNQRQKFLLAEARTLGFSAYRFKDDIPPSKRAHIIGRLEEINFPFYTDKERYQSIVWGHLDGVDLCVFQTPHGHSKSELVQEASPSMESSGDDQWLTVICASIPELNFSKFFLSSDIDYPSPVEIKGWNKVDLSSLPYLDHHFDAYGKEEPYDKAEAPYPKLLKLLMEDKFVSDHCDSLIITLEENRLIICRKELLSSSDLKPFIEACKNMILAATTLT